jgi:hypothetical protein
MGSPRGASAVVQPIKEKGVLDMRKVIVIGTIAFCAVFAVSTVASAEILADKSAEQKHRKDVGKQIAKLVACFAKSIEKCEKKGTSSASECSIADPPASTIADTKAKDKFVAAIDKCKSKLNLTKKGPASNYTVVGCVGDSDEGTAGDQPYTDLDDFQANVGQNTQDALALLGPAITALCDIDPAPATDANACTIVHIKQGGGYGKGVFKCMEKCENDYKDKKGNGGGTDDLDQCNPETSAEPNFNDCASKALDKANKKGTLKAAVIAALDAALGDANNDLYNENDCP